MIKIISLVGLLLIANTCFAQKLPTPISLVSSDVCGTPEPSQKEMEANFYYGNNDKLKQKYDSLAAIYGNVANNPNYRNSTFGGENGIWFRIPVKFWIYQWSPDGNFLDNSEKSMKSMIWAINDAYRRNSVPVRFFIACPTFVENQEATTGNISDGAINTLMRDNAAFGAINIHIVKRSGINFSNFYSPSQNAICLRRDVVFPNIKFPEVDINGTPSYYNGTFIHEIGHYFRLNHTHNFAGVGCFRELVTRGTAYSLCPPFVNVKQCDRRGDALCDTEADPNLDDYRFINRANCQWNGTLTDSRGDAYRPDPKNYMAYGERFCRSVITEGQKSIILDWAATVNRDFYSLITGWDEYANDFTDIYEPDGVDAMATPIKLNETQEHSLGNVNSLFCSDNDDWVSFKKPTLIGDLLVEIEDVGGFNNPVLDVEFWESNGTDISPKASVLRTYASVVNQNSKRIYRVACGSLVNDNIYLFRVRRNGTQTGRYTISFKEQGYVLSGQGRLCEGTNHIFTLYGFDVSQGTLTWLVSNGITLVSSAGNTATVVHSGYAGYGSVTARVTTPCGTKDFIQNLTLGNFLLLPAGATLNGNFNPVIGSTQVYTFPLPSNYESYNCVVTPIGYQPPYPYQWILQGCYVSNGQMTATVQVGTGIANVGFEVYMCGTLAGNFTWLMLPEKDPNCVYDFKIVYPNPTKESLTIERGQSGFCVGGMRINNNASLPYEIKLYDSYGVLKSVQITKTDNITLNVANLPSGLYILHIIQEGEIQQKRIFLE